MGFLSSLTKEIGRAGRNVSGAVLGTAPEAEVTSPGVLDPAQREALTGTLLPLLTGELEGGGGRVFAGGPGGFDETGGGAFTAPITESELTSLASLEQRALEPQGPGAGAEFLQNLLQDSAGGEGDTGPSQSTQFFTDLFNQGSQQFQVGAESPLAQFFSGDTEGFDEFFRAAVEQPLLESFERDILPAITRRATGTGNLFGSGTREAISRQGENLTDEIARQRAILSFQSREAGLGRALEAAGLSEQLGARGFEEARGREFGAAEQVAGREEAALGREFAGEQAGQQRQLEAALASEGLDLQRTQIEFSNILQNIQAQGLPRQLENQEVATQYAEFLRQEGVRDTRINQLLAAIGLPTLENIATVTGGTTGLLASFLQGGNLSPTP